MKSPRCFTRFSLFVHCLFWFLAIPRPQGSFSIVSDDFNRSTLNASVWAVEDPVGGGAFETVGAGSGDAHLKITVPGGANHDAWNPNNALRLMQFVLVSDFEVTAKFDSLPAQQYQFEGILIEDLFGAQLRFDILHDGSSQLRAFVGRNVNTATPAQVSRTFITDLPIPTAGNEGTIYLRVRHSGQAWTFFTSADGNAWNQAASFDLAFDVALVGLFAGNQQGAGQTAADNPEFAVLVDYFSSSEAPLTSDDGQRINQPPTASISSPAANAAFTAPANIAITAAVSDPDGAISSVEFYAGKKLLGTDTSSPFSFTWSDAPAGSYPLTVKVTDSDGAFVLSDAVVIAVNPSGGGAPTYTGMSLWLKADEGVTLNGSTVSEWADQSGQDRHATQTTVANQPTLVTAEIGKPGLGFDGVNDFMTFNLPVSGLDAMSIVLVANNRADNTGTSAGNAAIFWNETASWGTVYLSPFQSRVNFRFGTTATGNTPNFARPVSIGTDYSISVAVKDGTTDSLYVNGEQVWTDSFRSTPIAATQDIGNLGRGLNLNTYFAGDFLEVLVYSRALSDSERQAIESYLRAKYLANQAPSVTLTAPADSTSLTAPAQLTVTADASDPDGSISKVEFFAGSTLIGTATSSPYRVTWSDAVPGNHRITAKATDNAGAFRISEPISVAINPADGAGPPFSGLALWLKGDAGVSLDGSSVSAWADQSGQGRIATQSAAANQPTLVTGRTGRPGLLFDGASDFMTFTLPVNGLTGMSIFLFCDAQAASGGGSSQAGNAAIFWNETASWGTVYLSPFQNQVNWRFGTTQTGNRQIFTRPTPLSSEYTLNTMIKDGTIDSYYIDGALIDSLTGKLEAIAGCRDVGNLGRGYNDNTYWAGEILEVLVYTRALSDAERLAVEDYLITKYSSAPPPALGITRDGNTVLIAWPAASSGVTLESTDRLSAPIWSPVTDPPVVIGLDNTVTVQIEAGSKFYRLRQ